MFEGAHLSHMLEGAHLKILPNSMFGFAKKRGVITTFACFATTVRIASIKCAPPRATCPLPITMGAVVGRLYDQAPPPPSLGPKSAGEKNCWLPNTATVLNNLTL